MLNSLHRLPLYFNSKPLPRVTLQGPHDLSPAYFSNQISRYSSLLSLCSHHITFPLVPQKDPAHFCLSALTPAVPAVWNAVLSTPHIFDSSPSFKPKRKAISSESFPDTLRWGSVWELETIVCTCQLLQNPMFYLKFQANCVF